MPDFQHLVVLTPVARAAIQSRTGDVYHALVAMTIHINQHMNAKEVPDGRAYYLGPQSVREILRWPEPPAPVIPSVLEVDGKAYQIHESDPVFLTTYAVGHIASRAAFIKYLGGGKYDSMCEQYALERGDVVALEQFLLGWYRNMLRESEDEARAAAREFEATDPNKRD